jgi:hypothetical protein
MHDNCRIIADGDHAQLDAGEEDEVELEHKMRMRKKLTASNGLNFLLTGAITCSSSLSEVSACTFGRLLYCLHREETTFEMAKRLNKRQQRELEELRELEATKVELQSNVQAETSEKQ